MATMPVLTQTINGIDVATSLAVNEIEGAGDVLPNDGTTIVVFSGQSGQVLTITAVSQKKVQGLTLSDPAMTLAGDGFGIFGPFDPSVYNNTDGNVEFTYSGLDLSNTYYAAIKGVK